MSVVYLAVDDALDRKVALKLLHRHLARDPEARARLTREARASARLRHPNIPEIYDFSGADGGDGGRGYIVSEYVDGWSLAELLRRHPPTLPEIGVALVLRVAEALAHAHREGVVHRDVKPENILVGRDGVVKLTDFGIAHVVGGDAMTMTGTLLGSPLHMAPEQVRGDRVVDARVDVWGFGTVLFMAVTGGRHAFEGGNPHVVMRRILEGEREEVRRLSPHIDSGLAAIVDGCLTLDRDRRTASMEAVTAALGRWLEARGAADVDAVVRGHVSDPGGYARGFTAGLVERLMRRAEASPTPDEAVELLGRVLLLDPGHRAAEVALARRMRALRGHRALRLGLAGLVAAGVLAGGVALLWRDGGAPSEEVAPALTRVADAGGAGALPDAVDPPEAGAAVGASPEAPDVTQVEAPDVTQVEEVGPEEVPEIAAPLDASAAPEPSDAAASADRPDAAPARRPDAAVAEVRPDTTSAERPDAARPEAGDEHPPPARTVEVRVTVYPPAVRLRVAGRDVTPGVPLRLAAGRVEAVLTHPGCPACGEDVRTLEVAPDAAGRWSTHLVFSRGGASALAPARLSVRCRDAGGWVEGPDGARFACNREHTVPVSSERPTLVEFTAFDANGQRIATRRFTIRPDAPIVWQL
jgi:hypothetical protein